MWAGPIRAVAQEVVRSITSDPPEAIGIALHRRSIASITRLSFQLHEVIEEDRVGVGVRGAGNVEFSVGHE